MKTSQDRFLEELKIASPCSASWEGMSGSERVRFCGDCQLQVYNLSGMSRDQAMSMVQEAEGRICVRLLKRQDGTVLTQDCPVGLRALRRKLAFAWVRSLALLGLLIGGLSACSRKDWRESFKQMFPIGKPVELQPMMGEVFIPEPQGEAVMGRIAPPRQAQQEK
ncbi:MAG: hypothetical protein ACYTG5_18985 [Planctomycetota bacterium]|jgi:hypothetical protein